MLVDKVYMLGCVLDKAKLGVCKGATTSRRDPHAFLRPIVYSCSDLNHQESFMGAARARILIQGRVQGVSFRYHTMQEARILGLTGWVRNLWDGRVEVLLTGDEEAVKQMIEWCQQGPPSAAVDNVEVAWEEPTAEYNNFRVRINAGGRSS